MQILSSDYIPAQMSSQDAPQDAPVQPGETRTEDEKAFDSEKSPFSSQDASPQHSVHSSPKLSAMDQSVMDNPAIPEPEDSGRHTPPPPQRTEFESLSLSQISSASVAYLANRRSFDNSFSTPSTWGRTGDESFRYVLSFFRTRAESLTILPDLSRFHPLLTQPLAALLPQFFYRLPQHLHLVSVYHSPWMERLSWFPLSRRRPDPPRYNYQEMRIRYLRSAVTGPFTGAGAPYPGLLSRPSQPLLLIYLHSSPEADLGTYMPGNPAAKQTLVMS